MEAMEMKDVTVVERPAKRFKHQSYKETLKQVHLVPALLQNQFDHDISDNDSHFHEALLDWRELNLAPAFIRFARQSEGLSASMALLLHNWKEITDLWLEAIENAEDEALKPLLDLFQKLAHDLRTTIAPAYPEILTHLLALLSRSLIAETLSALLTTFTALFKYILIPTNATTDAVNIAWAAFSDVLPNCDPEVQRAVAEVWGNTLRRMKIDARAKCASRIAESAGTDVGAWVFVCACKSVSQTLHTTTQSFIQPLLEYHLSTAPDSEALQDSFTVIRRVLTALTHHCKTAEQFSPISDILLEFLQASPKEIESERLRRVLEVITIPCSVRGGSRIHPENITTILSQLLLVPLTDELHECLLKLCVSCLTAGDMAIWMGAGRKVFERAWINRPSLALHMTGALLDLGWGGWQVVALPHVVKRTLDLLEANTEIVKVLQVLSAAHKDGKLVGVDDRWRARLQGWAVARLVNWEATEVQVFALQHILTLADLLPNLGASLVAIIDATIRPTHHEIEPAQSSPWVIGACMTSLSQRPLREWQRNVDVIAWTTAVMKREDMVSNAFLLEGLVKLIRAAPPQIGIALPFSSVYICLQAPLTSYSRLTRLGTLRLLSSPAVTYTAADSNTSDVVKRVLQAEEIGVDVQSIRERVLRIARLNNMLKDGDETGADLVTRWLIAQLKVNLRPLWSPAAEALAAISERKGFGDIIWRFLFTELKAVAMTSTQSLTHSFLPGVTEQQLDEVNEEERTWRDPSAHKMRSMVTSWLRTDAAQRAIAETLHVSDRFDTFNYEVQLLHTLSTCSILSERHNRDLVPYFLSLVPHLEEPAKILGRPKLSAWLTLFAKFSNPKALHSAGKLRQLYTTLLAHPDRQLQQLALECVLTFKNPLLLKQADVFKALLDETRWRDQLVNLDVSSIGSEGGPEGRHDVVEVLVRLLFGMMLEKKAKGKGRRGLDRRKAVLGALSGCAPDELALLVGLMLGPIGRAQEVSHLDEQRHHNAKNGATYMTRPLGDGVTDSQILGFLNLLGDVMKDVGTRLVGLWDIIFGTLLDILAYAQVRISAAGQEEPVNEAEGEEAVGDDGNEGEEPQGRTGSGAGRAIRSVRQLGIKRLTDFFCSPVASEFNFTPYLAEAFRGFISPRIPLLAIENTQAPSALLELFYTWTLQPEFTPYLAIFDGRVLPKVYDCLVAPTVKPSVILKVFDIVDHLLDLSTSHEDILSTVFKPHIPALLANLATLVERTKGTASLTDQLGRRQMHVLSQLAPYMADSEQAATLLDLLVPTLRKPAKVVPEKLKVDMLSIVCSLLPLVDDMRERDSVVYGKTYALFAYLFQSLRSRQARLALVSAFRTFSELDTPLRPLAALLEKLNAYSAKRMDEPDFENRLEAFATLNDELHQSLTAKDWLPILYNMLNFIQDPEELSVRTNASASMKHFVDRVADAGAEYETTFLKVLLPGIKNGLRSKNELVRAELLIVLSYSVKKCESIAILQEMRPLLAAGDEEANFFNNVLHLQLHRRTRALRRLVEICSEGQLRSATLAEIFVPLVGNFTNSGTYVDHHLVNEAINTLGGLAKHLQWGAYYSTVQQYLRLIRNKDASERIYVRTLVSILDNFHFPMDSVIELTEATVEDNGTEESEPQEEVQTVTQPDNTKSRSVIADVVNSKLLPSLLQHLEKRDETDDNLRIPMAIGIVHVVRHLPQSTREAQISRLITVLSQVFRSKSQETRDLAKETLCKIAIILGPPYLPEILRELRIALIRGPHLHVLAFVTHALLVHVTSGHHAATFAVLDDCVSDVAHVSAEVIFGESGKDVQSENFKTKMREVRGSATKGLDSFSTIAKHITPPKISSLLVPVRKILQQTETLRAMQQVEDLLRRIAGGLNANEHLTPAEILTLCHTLISQNAKFLKQVAKPSQNSGKSGVDAVVEMKKNIAVEVDHYANNSFRFIVFGLELFNTAHRRNRFNFQDAMVVARLETMVPVIGNTLYSKHMQVLIPALKAAAAIVKCPLKSIPKSLPVFIRQMIDIVKQTGSTESEAVQAAFKSLATVLRDQPTAQVKEKDLIFLLELLSPDLEEPERQASVFTMLRAIVARKFVVPEIYDLMVRVSEIMVTNQSPSVQELCRGVLLQFLLEYPQGKGRLRNHMTFLAKNLSYVHESGRKSVLEILNAILLKFDPALIREYSDLLFVAFVMVIANDDSTKCREMASELIKSLFSRLEDPQRRVVMSHIHSWASHHSQPQLARVSSQVYSILIDHLQDQVAPYISAILTDSNTILATSAKSLDEASATNESSMVLDVEWQISYHALVTLGKLLRVFPGLATEDDKVRWPHVITHLLFPHAWVRLASCRLLGVLFAAVSPAAPKPTLSDESPFSLVGMEDVAKKMCLQLRSENLDAALGVQIVKNVYYIGRCFLNTEAVDEDRPGGNEDEDEDEDENENEDEEPAANQQNDGEDAAATRHPLSWLFSKLSYQARLAHIARRNKSSSPPNWFEQPACVLRWFAAMVSVMEAPRVEKFLVHILSPVYRIVEDDTIRDSHMDELKTLAVELQDLVQSKVGTTTFANVYNRIRQNVLGVRRERKTARVVQAATNPQMASKRKMHRNVAKKDSRKRKNTTYAEGRVRIKRRRDE